jgi:hypothetical protein
MNKLIRHTTVNADSRIRRSKGGIVNIWNESSTLELTMTILECKTMEKDHDIFIEDIVSDELMGKLLHHFKDGGMLMDEEGERV